MRLAGIEPTTPWFVAKYSIQLSYSREAAHYSRIFGARSIERCGSQHAIGGACIVALLAGQEPSPLILPTRLIVRGSA